MKKKKIYFILDREIIVVGENEKKNEFILCSEKTDCKLKKKEKQNKIKKYFIFFIVQFID